MTEDEVIERLAPILDLASGADGGIGFVRLQQYLKSDDCLIEVEDLLVKFSKLCDYFLEDSK